MKNRNITFTAILFALVCLALIPTAQAVGPDTDGAIPGSNNGEGIGVLVSRTGGVWNTGTGFEALNDLTGGNQNTATGLRALTSDTNGGFNTATGVFSLFSNINGFFNSATGAYSLANNISGIHNTANGYAALYRNTADNNTATGFAALYHNITGTNNTANGYQALFHNTTVGGNFGRDNTAVGFQALISNTTGNSNTAIGAGALLNNTGGSNNAALGSQAGLFQNTGSDNVYIGAGVLGVAGESDACYIKSIFGQTSASGLPVLINSNNKLGTTTSSKRFKVDIRPMDKASEGLYALKPVTFHYKKEIDPAGIAQFGLVAEEVEKVNRELVVRDKEGKPYSVRYDQVNAMLLNEFLKEHGKMQEQEATIAKLEKQIEKLAAGLQKVSDQLELSKPAPQMVKNP